MQIRLFLVLAVLCATPLPAADDVAASVDPDAGNLALLPAAPARDLVIRTCAVCHPADVLAAKKRTSEAWGTLLNRMVEYGVRANDEQLDQIYGYFTTQFLGTDTSTGPELPPK